jgi:hypothetical protein
MHLKSLNKLYKKLNQSGDTSLNQLLRDVSSLKSYQDCFVCLMRAPEKVLDCGHSFCDVCIRAFGSFNSITRKFSFSQCVICSESSSLSFKPLPPTVGIRILSIDGGGIRGIVPLTILDQLDKDFAYLGCPIWDFFDYVVGTSSGEIYASL